MDVLVKGGVKVPREAHHLAVDGGLKTTKDAGQVAQWTSPTSNRSSPSLSLEVRAQLGWANAKSSLGGATRKQL